MISLRIARHETRPTAVASLTRKNCRSDQPPRPPTLTAAVVNTLPSEPAFACGPDLLVQVRPRGQASRPPGSCEEASDPATDGPTQALCINPPRTLYQCRPAAPHLVDVQMRTLIAADQGHTGRVLVTFLSAARDN